MNKFDFRICAVLAVPTVENVVLYYIITSDGGMMLYSRGFDSLPNMVKKWIYAHNKPEYLSSWVIGQQYMHLMSDKEVA